MFHSLFVLAVHKEALVVDVWDSSSDVGGGSLTSSIRLNIGK